MLSRDVHVLGLSATASRQLRNALARSLVIVDIDAPDGTVHVPAHQNHSLSLTALLEKLQRWASAAGISELPIAYGDGSPRVLIVSAETQAHGGNHGSNRAMEPVA